MTGTDELGKMPKVGASARMLILGAMVACLGAFALAGSAQAAPASMSLTNGQLNLGS